MNESQILEQLDLNYYIYGFQLYNNGVQIINEIVDDDNHQSLEEIFKFADQNFQLNSQQQFYLSNKKRVMKQIMDLEDPKENDRNKRLVGYLICDIHVTEQNMKQLLYKIMQIIKKYTQENVFLTEGDKGVCELAIIKLLIEWNESNDVKIKKRLDRKEKIITTLNYTQIIAFILMVLIVIKYKYI